MLRNLKRLVETYLTTEGEADPDTAERAYQLAAATLLVEMTRADFEVHAVERDAAVRAIGRAFSLGDEEAGALVAEAEAEADAATSLHEFTSLINTHFGPRQKFHLIELMWRVAFADGAVDKYEDHLVRKVADLIHVPHRQFIRAKLTVQEGRTGQS